MSEMPNKFVARNTHGTPLKQCTVVIITCLKSITTLNTFAVRLIQAVRAKTAGSQWLCLGNSPVW